MPRIILGAFCAAAATLALSAESRAAPDGIALAQASHSAAATGVPPGLAKKGKIPPGHAKKWRVGDRLPGDVGYIVLHDPGRYGLPRAGRDEMWVQVDGDVLKIARASLLVLAAAGAVADLAD